MQKRVVVVGLARSGTTWLARILSSGPGVAYLHEPDNVREGLLPWMPFDGLGPFPALAAGDEAPRFRLVWRLAFAGGWREGIPVRVLRKVTRATFLPRQARIWTALGGARLAARVSRGPRTIVVKTVRAYLATEWLAHEFDPDMVVIWRHPLNTVPAWSDHGWTSADPLASKSVVRRRLQGTAAWPPPADGAAGAAWAICAATVILLETAARHPDWHVVHHEAQCLSPVSAFHSLLERLRLPAPDDLQSRIEATDQEGTGYEIRRRIAQEPGRWRKRLAAEDQGPVLEIVDRFSATSEVAARAWSSSPALTE